MELLNAFEELRVADVRDGLDTLMYHDYGSMVPNIRPLFRTRAYGIAKTVRYLPYRGNIPGIEPKKYMRWANKYYREICSYAWMATIKEGDFIVIDASGVNAGLFGSENSLLGRIKGARGYVTNRGVRDTDEIILEKVPFWSAMISQKMVQGLLQYDDCDIPVAVGGVTVYPGDVIVADGDGVVVCPQEIALDVAKYAHEEHEQDKKVRRSHYKTLSMEPDDTI
ncbi:MAG: RraA family protein [Promethearchaeota archaeon]